MKPSLQQYIHNSLEFGEDLIWSGRPDPLRIARARVPAGIAGLTVIILLPTGLIYQAFASLVPLSASVMTSWPISVALLLIGLHLLLSPVRGYRSALRTFYAVTDRRLVTVRRNVFGTSIWSARIDAIEVPILKLRPDRTGDIFFPPKAFAAGIDVYASGLAYFLGVSEPRQVHELILKTLLSSNARQEAEPVQDYLDLLIRGRRSLDDSLRRIREESFGCADRARDGERR